jgi:hypothetical protein
MREVLCPSILWLSKEKEIYIALMASGTGPLGGNTMVNISRYLNTLPLDLLPEQFIYHGTETEYKDS